MHDKWLLLIYALPAQPSRLRLSIWRDLKGAGALYLRDGVTVLPDRPPSRAMLEAIAKRVEELGGEATLVVNAELDQSRHDELLDRFARARAGEYEELLRQCRRFMSHLQRETDHYEFTYQELEELAEELDKIRRWQEKVRGRDYFNHEAAAVLEGERRACEEALAAFGGEAFEREHGELARAGIPRTPAKEETDALDNPR